jgi:hypothetical protein
MNNGVFIRMTRTLYQQLTDLLLEDENEKHAFVMGYGVRSDERYVVTCKEIVTFRSDEIEVSPVRVRIDSALVDGVFHTFANCDFNVLISCHSHPFEKGDVWFSSIDDENDRRLFDYFYDEMVRHKPDAHLFTAVFAHSTVAVRGYDVAKKSMFPVERLIVSDIPLRIIVPTNHPSYNTASRFVDATYDRQVLAFGQKGQELLRRLRIGLVGAGGTGSIAAEVLMRLGIKDLLIVDADRLEQTNLNRWQGGKMSDVGRYKVDVLKERLEEAGSGTEVRALRTTLFDNEAMTALKGCDILIGAVDDDRARYVLNRMSVSYLIPYLDCSSGIVLGKQRGTLKRIAVRNVCVVPSVTPCFNCNGYFFREDLPYLFLPGHMRKEAKRQKYINDDAIDSPAVYPLNMLSVAFLMTEFMNLIFGFKKAYENIFVDIASLHDSKPVAWCVQNPSSNCIDCNDRMATGDEGGAQHLAAMALS